MLVKALTLVAALVVAPAAFAASAADLVTTISVSPATSQVYSVARYTVQVANTGNRNASACTVAISLPATHTSPQVYVLGNLGATSAGCTLSGTTLNCTLGTINRNTSKTAWLDIGLPVNDGPLTFVATAATSTNESNYANNTASRNAAQTYFSTTVAASPGVPAVMNNRHCTGTGLTAWMECTFFPSSISAHTTEFFDDGSIGFPGNPGYTGQWTLTPTASGSFLEFYYEDGSGIVAEFEGWGADALCFEGITSFPGGGPWIAPYEVCPL